MYPRGTTLRRPRCGHSLRTPVTGCAARITVGSREHSSLPPGGVGSPRPRTPASHHVAGSLRIGFVGTGPRGHSVFGCGGQYMTAGRRASRTAVSHWRACAEPRLSGRGTGPATAGFSVSGGDCYAATCRCRRHRYQRHRRRHPRLHRPRRRIWWLWRRHDHAMSDASSERPALAGCTARWYASWCG